jgi:two-component system cell cycle sensor histidine kinase/response regulator CckA
MKDSISMLELPGEQRMAVLVRIMREAEQELEALTGGQVDAVTGVGGRPLLLHEAQEKLRQSEGAQRQLAQTQIAILDALPAHIALLNREGKIISVNGAWRRFAASNAFQGSKCGVGQNYLVACERARGKNAKEGALVAAGLRKVLKGEAKEFTLDYPCHAPRKLRWFKLIITPLHQRNSQGAVITHLDITERKLSEESLKLFRALIDQSNDSIEVVDPRTGHFLDFNERAAQRLGYSREEMLSLTLADIEVREGGESSMSDHPDETRRDGFRIVEGRHRRKDGTTFPIEANVQYIDLNRGYLVAVVRDITERLRENEQLARNQALLRVALRVSRMGAWKVDLPECTLKWSDETASLHDELPGFSPTVAEAMNYYTPESRNVIRLAFESCVREGTSFDLEAQINTAKGRRLSVRAIGEAVREADGRIVQVQGACQDIESVKQAEELIRASEERFRLLAQVSTDAIWHWDALSNQCWWSEGSGIPFGYGDQSFSLESWTNYIHLDDSTRVVNSLRDFIEGDSEVWSNEYRFRCHDNTFVYVSARAHMSRDIAGKPLRMVGGLTDVTQRKSSEERLTEQAALLDISRDAILVNNMDGLIIYWNKGAELTYGWTAQEALGRESAQLLSKNPIKLREAFEVLMAKDEWRGELIKRTKDGRELTVEARWTLVRDIKNRPKSILSIDTDITEKKRLEAAFMRAQRMESIGTLAGGIAHDLNNILAPIVMSLDLLKTPYDSPKTSKILQTIEVSAKRGADIVRQVLSFARGLEGQRIGIEPQHLLKDLEDIIRDTFPKDIRLEFSILGTPWAILGDPTQIHQVLLNLCVNARDAMPSGGDLALSVENCLLDEHYAAMHSEAKPGRYVKIRVTDSGMGIPPKLIDKIFEPFFTTKELNKGTGLGLSTVSAIVKSHGGIIDVYSDLGKGAAFTVFLPAIEVSPKGQRAELANLPRGKGETILVVDDETAILTITSQTLEAFGYDVLTAADGADALALYLQHRDKVAVVLTDMMMPLMDGAALVRALKRINPAIKIVTASGLNVDAETGERTADFQHSLSKPYTAGTMLKAIRLILDGR